MKSITNSHGLRMLFLLLSVLELTVAQGDWSLAQAPVALPTLNTQDVPCSGTLNTLSVTNTTQGVRPSAERPKELSLTSYFSFHSQERFGALSPSSTFHLIPAALQALDEINNSSDILADYHLTLDLRDSQCDPVVGRESLVSSIIHRSASDPPTVGLVGPGCSEVSEALAGVYGRFLYIPQVSYGQNSPRLSSRTDYPSFFQMVHSIEQTTETLVGVLKHFDWTNRIALVYEDARDYIVTAQNVVQRTEDDKFVLTSEELDVQANIEEYFELQQEFELQPQLEAFLNNLREKLIRVIVGLFPERTAARLVCVALQNNMTQPGDDGFVFVFSGLFSNQWWSKDNGLCNLTLEDVESVIVVTGIATTPDLTVNLPVGKTVHDFKVNYGRKLLDWCPGYKSTEFFKVDPLAGATYDAVWSIALALNQSTDLLSQVDSTLRSDLLAQLHDQTTQRLLETNFNGASGDVRFNSLGERVGLDAVLQVQSGSFVLIGYYNSTSIELEIVDGAELMWKSDSDVTPSDVPTEKEESVPLWMLVTAVLFTLAGIIFGIFMIVFNWHYGRHQILRASSQRLNYIIITGVFFGYISVIILTILESPLGQLMNEETFKVLCIIRIWMLPLAFTLSYGTLFARAWRIYRIFNDPWVSNRPLKDYHLMLIVLLVAIGDLAYLIPWTIIDPFRQSRSDNNQDFSSFTSCVYVSCSSDYHIAWLAVTAVYKICLMIAGLLIINLVRQHVVKKKIFDDSKSLAAALYTTAVAFVVGTALALFFLLQFQIVFAYVTSVIWVNVSSSGTLVCVFLPKYYQIVLKKQKGREYKSAKSLFYVAHPDVEPSEGGTPSPYRRATIDPETTNVTDFDITEADIGNIRGTESETSF